jgi:predicted AlkP superfamily pyrophosphatase or phosphodiesterase
MRTTFSGTIQKLGAFGALLIALCGSLFAQNVGQNFGRTLDPVVTVDHGPNTPVQQKKPYVVLVSLDGFRYDYAQRYGARNLEALAARGASAPQGMIPSFPSLTFPNHYTMVTGLYPAHHGIVANAFYDPARHQRYAFNDPITGNDGSWYGGTPLWVLAEQQGMRTACFFWPGSEAEIAGGRPSYYQRFNNKYPDGQRIDQVIAWLHLPSAERPHFVTLYFSKVDTVGHEFGPESPQTADAVRQADGLIGRLASELDRLPIPVDLFVVSDHGMAAIEGDWINLDRYAGLAEFETDGPLLYPKSNDAAERAYQQLRGASSKFVVYRRNEVPPELHYDGNSRAGDPVVVATGPYAIRALAPRNSSNDKPPLKGGHGFDPRRVPSMRTIFYAAGPDIRPGIAVAPFENVHLYPVIAKILGLRMGPIDGDPKVLEGILKRRAGN